MNLELTPSFILRKLNSLLSHHSDGQSDTSESTTESEVAIVDSPKKILVAYSGGLDSHVLLHLLSLIPRNQFDLRAIYINHGLQVQAIEWAEHCQTVCDELKIPFESIDLNLKIPKGESLEEVARKARYEALYSQLQQDEVLVTAHHQSDQAETLLLQLFRGAGVQGLASMAIASKIEVNNGSCIHFRPFLDQSRQALESYASEFGLNHIEDPSNKDTTFDRNFLRQDIMPLLRQRWLGIDKSISRAATLQAETKTLLDEVAHTELPAILASKLNCYNPHQCNEYSTSFPPIDISKLLKLSIEKQRLLLRYWISQQGFSNPSSVKIQHIFSDLINSGKDKQPCIEWRGVELRRYQQLLYIMPPLTEHDVSQVIPWTAETPLNIPSLNTSLSPELIEISQGQITVRFRNGGETIEIPKRGNISLKNLFQELHVPPWVRSRLPLIYIGEKLHKIVGLEDFKRHPPTL